MDLIEPGGGKALPSVEYAEYMRVESIARRTLHIGMSVPGVLREADRVNLIIRKMDEPRRAAYTSFMRLRQEAFVASDVRMEIILAASAIDTLAEMRGVEPEFVPRQLQRMWRANRCAIKIVPTVVASDHLGGIDNRGVFFGTDPTPAIYEQFAFSKPGEPHERWHAPGSPDAMRLAAAQQMLFHELTGESAQ